MSKRSSDRGYRQWRAKVIRRDGGCVICGSKKRRAAHHMNCWSYFPESRYDMENGVTLCGFHHMLFHTSYKNSYREKCTIKEYKNFIEMLTRLAKWQEVDGKIIKLMV